MPDPMDPRDAALANIQDSSRAFGRGRRRGDTANVDPAFAAALELTDPEQRRAALAQYARQRAQALFPEQTAPVESGLMPDMGDAPMFSVEDKLALAPTYGDQVDERNERNDDARIESRNAGKPPPDEYVSEVPADGISQIGDAVTALQQRIQATRRRR
jgi:hypothetical protein